MTIKDFNHTADSAAAFIRCAKDDFQYEGREVAEDQLRMAREAIVRLEDALAEFD
jgi:hypothetical protein